jgi:hypothetical protein
MQDQQKKSSDTRTAGASEDRTPRVGIILSSFKGGEDHFGGTKFAALPEPRPPGADLTPSQVREMTRRAMELGNTRRGGLERIVRRDEWTVLLVSREADPVVVAAVEEILRERGVAKVEKLVAQQAGQAGADAMQMPAPGVWSRRDVSYRVPKSLLHCDRVISIAPLRIERGRPMLTIDNYRGAAETAPSAGSPDLIAADIFGFHAADYAVLGGTRLLREGKATRHNLVVAGPFAASVDAVGAAILGVKPAEVPLLTLANQRGYGETDLDVIWMRGNEIEEARPK